MEGDEIANLSGKITPASGIFSTLESIQATIKEVQIKQSQQGSDENNSIERIEKIRKKNIIHQYQKAEDQCQSRLFTFMDERDCEKLFIQNYFLRTIHQIPLEDKENHPVVLNQASSPQSKKQEYFLQINRQSIQKLALRKQPSNLSKSNNDKISTHQRAKTPKILKNIQNTKASISPKQYHRSSKSRNKRSITPKYNKQNRRFPDCNNLDDRNSMNGITYKWKKKQIVNEYQQGKMRDTRNIQIQRLNVVKSLVKKKKELQRQLTLINDSLVSLKRKNDIWNKIKDTVKDKRKQQGNKVRKSLRKFSKNS